jgi:outer membrane protein insertion porin family
MATRKKGFFSFITGSGKYEETTFETDLERIKYFYIDNGYIDVKVTDYSLDFKEENSDLFITITLDEGALYTIEDIAITGNTVYSSNDVHNVINVAPEAPFSRTAIRKDIVAISNLYAKKGYLTPLSEKTEGKLLIDPRFTIDREANKVSLTYAIREGVPHFLNRITIAGNQNTRDKVIRRELKLHEDELFNKSKLERDRQRVFNLGFFEDVEFTVLDGSEENTVDLNIDVSERSLGSFNFGGGWGSIDSFFVTGGITYPNVFGLAHSINFSTSLSSTSQTFSLKYTIPRFLDSPYLVGIDTYKTAREYTSYDLDTIGGGLRLGRKITDRVFGTIKYEYKESDITDVEDDASTIIQEAEGESITSSASLLLKYSNINNVLLPTKGLQTKLTGKVAGGILQGENDFYKLILNNNIYLPVYRDVAFRIKSEFAHAKEYDASEDLPIFERFFGGGAETIRGYEERSIGPKDENDEAIGGNTRIVLTTELIIPITKQVRLVTFFDAGDVYASEDDIDVASFKKSVGLGARFYVPMLGLLRFDWGYKLEKESGESDSEFHFGIGAPL